MKSFAGLPLNASNPIKESLQGKLATLYGLMEGLQLYLIKLNICKIKITSSSRSIKLAGQQFLLATSIFQAMRILVT